MKSFKSFIKEQQIAPHGDAENELRMMRAGTKPAALIMKTHYDDLYRPYVGKMKWEVKKFKLPDGSLHYAVGQRGETDRVNRIAKLVRDENLHWAKGGKSGPDYHQNLGRLLGYHQDDIDHFNRKMYGDNFRTQLKPSRLDPSTVGAGLEMMNKGVGGPKLIINPADELKKFNDT